jgi:hypothetical protein
VKKFSLKAQSLPKFTWTSFSHIAIEPFYFSAGSRILLSLTFAAWKDDHATRILERRRAYGPTSTVPILYPAPRLKRFASQTHVPLL